MKNRYDRLFLVILAGVILLLFLYQHFAGSKGSYILVTQNGEKIGEYSLLENQTFVVTDENDTPYSFTFEEKPEGLENVSNGDTVTIKYTGTISEVDPFEGEVISVEEAK